MAMPSVQKLDSFPFLSLRWTRLIPYDKINATDMVNEYLTILDCYGFRPDSTLRDKSKGLRQPLTLSPLAVYCQTRR